jgi:hypothetical protein
MNRPFRKPWCDCFQNKSQDPSTVMQKLAEWDEAHDGLAEAQPEEAAA